MTVFRRITLEDSVLSLHVLYRSEDHLIIFWYSSYSPDIHHFEKVASIDINHLIPRLGISFNAAAHLITQLNSIISTGTRTCIRCWHTTQSLAAVSREGI